MALTNFAGAVAVITGGASGMGLATGKALYTRGAYVALADMNKHGLEQAQEQFHQPNPAAPGQVITIPTDVTDDQQVQALMRKVVENFGRIDLVVTCAGSGRSGPIDTFSPKEMQAIMDVNFLGTYNCVVAALPTMRQQQSGHFVFLCSVAGKLGVPYLTAYCATKWVVRGFSSALRAELYGTGIGVTTVYPEWVDTPMFRQEADVVQLLNVKPVLKPEQVAEEILQAVTEGKNDLTLAPSPDIAMILQIMHDDPDKAEQLTGASFHRRLARYQQRQNTL